MWVELTDDISLRCCENDKGKRYRYEKKTGDNIEIISHENNSPTQTTNQSQFHKFLKNLIIEKQLVYPNQLDDKIISIKNELENKILKNVTVDEESKTLKNLDEKYAKLYTDFQYFLVEYGMTPLELIVAVSHCLGVGKPREVVRAFLGYFQTYVGYKGTNVIAIGSPASGKSFILETALGMIPSERIIKGAKTVAYFFNKYNGRDMTGYIFYIGDLGGDDDNQNTIEFRDVLKQLSTDGYVERGLMDKESNEEQEQVVTGYPSLSYTTAKEEMVNEQEKTRSIILTPNPVDTGKLMVYNFLMDNHGKYHDDIEKFLSIRDSVQGLVHMFNPNDYDFFNPYMFCIEEHLKDHDDFNRKILEFDAILKLVTLLNNPQSVQHHLYYDDDFEQKSTKVYIASKRDNINALNIFDSANLLPDEVRFANGIIKEYDTFKFEEVSEDDLWEDVVRANIQYNIDEHGLIVMDKELREQCFTLKSLKASHRYKAWYKKSKNYVADRVSRLVDENVLVNIGKEQGSNHNVYCLNKGMESSVESALPNFSKGLVDKASHVFKMVYPDQYDEYLKFVEDDKDNDSSDLFEKIEPIIKDLPYLEEIFCVL